MSESVPPEPVAPRKRSLRRLAIMLGLSFLGVYLIAAYILMPAWWDVYERRHPALKDVPGITNTTVGIPADPLNVAVFGTKSELLLAMKAAGWHPADPLTLKSSLEIAADTVFRREYVDAPVSSLYLFGRKEDLAFEKPIGHDPRKRNHVRFWKAPNPDADGRPLWLGAATMDRAVGLSHTTGEITHHVAANIDAERDLLVSDLAKAVKLKEESTVPDFHAVKQGKNGGGDPWTTDGALKVCVLP